MEKGKEMRDIFNSFVCLLFQYSMSIAMELLAIPCFSRFVRHIKVKEVMTSFLALNMRKSAWTIEKLTSEPTRFIPRRFATDSP